MSARSGRSRTGPAAPRCAAVECALLAAASVLLAAACTRRAPTQEIQLFAWSEYVPEEVTDGFTAETGIRVNVETFASNEEMLAKLLSGAVHYDVVQPSDYVVEALAREGRLQPIDPAKIPRLRDVSPDFLHLPFDPEQRWTIPWMGGTVGIVVNSERVPPESIRSFADVFTEAHRGRIVVVDDPREIVSWALATEGLPINGMDEASLVKVEPLLRKWIPLVRVFDSDSPKTALLDGDVDLGVVWSGEGALLLDEDPKFRWILPAEGAHRFVDSLAIPSDARNPEGAHRFLDWVLRPEVSARVSGAYPYTNPNLAARRLLSPRQLANPASYPPGEAKLEFFRDVGAAAVAVDQLVARIKAGG
ncbi:MAG: spermidine/putrescine ABC transporter substrate-binding protein [Alphaproteobacteria bacterium]